jgi:NAD(P)-dependent dehydrogenase (short-subunit alcohol dehydrogenase family)
MGGTDLSDQIVIVTGGSGLLGSKIVEDFIKQGFTVISLDINELEYKAPKFRHMHCDISIQRQVNFALESLTNPEEIVALVHCAALDPKVTSNSAVATPFEDQSLETISREFDVSIRGGLNVTQALLKLIGNDWKTNRSIVLVGSDLGVISPDQRVYRLEDGTQTFFKPISYSILKHGIVGMTKYLATMLAERNIRVNCISPGPILDQQPNALVKELESRIPMGRLASISEIVGVVNFLTSNLSNYITGQNIIVDGGRTIW